MTGCRWLLVAVCVCAFGSARAESDPQTLWAYKYVLATAMDFRDLGAVSQRMFDDEGLRTQEMLDLGAELLVTHATPDSEEDVARSHIIRLIAENRRYFTVLQRIATENTDSYARKSARAAFARNKKLPAVEQFKAGMSKAAALRDEYARAALAAIPTDAAAKHLAELPRRSDLASVFAWAGQPQAASSRFRNRGPGAQYQRLALYYRGLGRVELQFNGDIWIARRVVIAPLAFEDYMPYRIDPAKYGQISDDALAITQLVSDERAAIRLMLDLSEHYDTAALELMDTAAERLLHDLALETPPLSQDNYDWMCVLLTHDGGNRYADVLAKVAALARTDKLKAFASEKIDASKHPDESPYVPGTLTFEARRAKYPSPYPDRTYTFGRP